VTRAVVVRSVAVAIVCKTPAYGQSKTRLSPPLTSAECAEISSCFIRDLSATIAPLTADGDVTGYALYAPRGSEHALGALLPGGFRLLAQSDGDLSARLIQGALDLLGAGHAGVIFLNSDSPTLPACIVREAVKAVRRADNVVLGAALDGGYTLIGLSQPHPHVFEDIPWSTSAVYAVTRERVATLGLPLVELPMWYDVDDEASLHMLEAELSGCPPPFAKVAGADAPATRRFLIERRQSASQQPLAP
jgi:rSAM/selenodomain-associated transferase 1